MSEHKDILEQTVDRLFRDIKKAEASGTAPAEQLWEQIEELGIADIFRPEDQGGMHGNWQDASIIFRHAGYHAIALPVGETTIGRKIIHEHGLEIPEGPVAFGQSFEGSLLQGRTRFSGKIATQSTAIPTSKILATMEDKSGCHFVVLHANDAMQVTPKTSVADEPRHTYVFDQAECSTISVPSPSASMLLHCGALLRACQSAGVLRAMLEMCIQFTHDRTQFGRPLKKFQAIQHQLALLAEEAAAVSSAAGAAALACDHGDAAYEIACAKLRMNQSVSSATSIAHQVHGAIGFTREYPLYHYTQRLWAWRSEFGNDRHWAQYLGKHMLQLQDQSPWQFLTSRGQQ